MFGQQMCECCLTGANIPFYSNKVMFHLAASGSKIAVNSA
jgi:hypothetical protein